jgi:hypothetical protein
MLTSPLRNPPLLPKHEAFGGLLCEELFLADKQATISSKAFIISVVTPLSFEL